MAMQLVLQLISAILISLILRGLLVAALGER
jgi:hypothetical protein